MARPIATAITRCSRRALVASLIVVAPLLALAAAPPALAVERHPTGEFAPFVDCPLVPAPEVCLVAETTSGSVTIGNETVPISNPMTLQGGVNVDETTDTLEFVGAENGETLSKTPQTVPGGLLGVVAPEFLPTSLQKLLNKLISEGLAGVTATTELAAPASDIGLSTEDLLDEEGTALSLPVKIKLSNPLLGSACYIGSNSHPVVIELTTGTTSPPLPTEPISGSRGHLSFNSSYTLAALTGTRLVNNSFAAPEAHGCGGLLSLVVDTAVNVKLGLPSAAGKNSAILGGSELEADAQAVTESE